MAVLLQYLCIKLGVASQMDLAQSCRKMLPPRVNILFYILCELAIIACDLAEVVGTAIALNLLFGMPMWLGVLVTALDVLLILAGWSTKHIRIFELFIFFLFSGIGICFSVLIYETSPDWSQVLRGYIPTMRLFTDKDVLYVAMGIIGATVMPHNLYLHSSIVKSRSFRGGQLGEIHENQEEIEDERSYLDANADENASIVDLDKTPLLPNQGHWTSDMINEAIRMSNFDSVSALTMALLINSSILIVAGTAFHNVKEDVGDLSEAYKLLVKSFGSLAGYAFAIALLFSGQSSTITGTLAGQICMQGFLGSQFRIAPWIRRLTTRSLAIIPAMIVAIYKGNDGVNDLLVFSQVVLSLQLPFAIWPLIVYTSSRAFMTVTFVNYPSTSTLEECESSLETIDEDLFVQSDFSNSWLLTIIAYIIGILITLFNVVLLIQILF